MIELIKMYVSYYYKSEFEILCSGVAILILSNLYERFVKNGEISPLEDEKDNEKYFIAGERFKTEKYDKLRVAKAAYALKKISVID